MAHLIKALTQVANQLRSAAARLIDSVWSKVLLIVCSG